MARNVIPMRNHRGMTGRALSTKLEMIGWPILPSGITKLELCQRKVTVDDLVALAEALSCRVELLLQSPCATESALVAARNAADSMLGVS